MKPPSSGASCERSKKRWPTRIWNWRWRRPSWWWPVKKWTRAWKLLKKSMLAGGAPGDRGQPRVKSDLALPAGEHDSTKLLCTPKRLAPREGGCAIHTRPGPGRKGASAALGSQKALLHDPSGIESGWSEDGPGPAL